MNLVNIVNDKPKGKREDIWVLNKQGSIQ